MNDNPAEAIADGEQARHAMERWLGPAFEAVEEAWAKRLAEVAQAEPWATDKIGKLAIALRISKEVRSQIEQVIHEGKVALTDERNKRRIENLPSHQRKWAQM